MRGLTAIIALVALLTATSAWPIVGSAAPTTQRYVIQPGDSNVTYRVNEILFNQGNRLNTAVGTTTAVRGEVTVDRARPANSKIGTVTIDISQFKSDSQRRDNMIRQNWLESSRFPNAEFTAMEIKGLPDTYQDGREVPVQITGNLKIRDVTKPTTWVSTIKLDGTMLTVTGTTTIKMTDYGFDPPSILGILKSENEARLEFRLVARAGS